MNMVLAERPPAAPLAFQRETYVRDPVLCASRSRSRKSESPAGSEVRPGM